MSMKCKGALLTNWQVAHIFLRHIIFMCVHKKEWQASKQGSHWILCNLQLAVATCANSTITSQTGLEIGLIDVIGIETLLRSIIISQTVIGFLLHGTGTHWQTHAAILIGREDITGLGKDFSLFGYWSPNNMVHHDKNCWVPQPSYQFCILPYYWWNNESQSVLWDLFHYCISIDSSNWSALGEGIPKTIWIHIPFKGLAIGVH